MLQNLFHSVPNNPINSKKRQEKKNPKALTVEGGGSKGGMSIR